MLLGSLLLPHLLSAQVGATCRIFGTPQVNTALVRLKQAMPDSVYKRGKPIPITLTLQAGPEGVYLPNFFGDFNSACSHGFSAELLTLAGRAADPRQQGCAYVGPIPQITYIALSPREFAPGPLTSPLRRLLPGNTVFMRSTLPLKERPSPRTFQRTGIAWQEVP